MALVFGRGASGVIQVVGEEVVENGEGGLERIFFVGCCRGGVRWLIC